MPCEMGRTRVLLLRFTTGEAIFRAAGSISSGKWSSREAALSIFHNNRDTTKADGGPVSALPTMTPVGRSDRGAELIGAIPDLGSAG